MKLTRTAEFCAARQPLLGRWLRPQERLHQGMGVPGPACTQVLLSKLSVGSSARKALPVSHLLGSKLDFTSSSSKPVVREAARLDNCSQSPSIMNHQAHSGRECQTHGEVPACLKLLQQMAPSPQYFSRADGLVCIVLHKSLTRKQGMCRPPGRLRARFALRPDTSADHGTSVGSLYRLPICSGSRLVQDSY